MRIGSVKWRKDIEGLRAFAVIPVLLFHFDPHFLHGGFLGVDIFFVISGFLITKILLENKSQGLQDIAAFLYRRFWRIFPGLLVVFAIFSVVFSFFLVPGLHKAFFLTALSSFFGASNVYLAKTQVDYFAQDTNLNPFLHSWSIGVELQFYVLYGLMFFVLRKLLPHQAAVKSVLFVFAIFWILVSCHYNQHTSGYAYFDLFARMWEFMFGVLAFLLLPYAKQISPFIRRTIFFLALIGLLCVLFFAEKNSANYFPFLWVCIAAALLLLLGDSCGVPGSYILENRLVRTIGRISFSLYIIHFPVLKLLEYYFDTKANNFGALSLYLAITFFLASINFIFIERPFIVSRPVSVNSFLTTKHVLFPLFLVSLAVVLVAQYKINPSFSMTRILTASLANPKIKPVLEGDKGEVVVLGDSHAQQLFPAFEEINRDHNIKFINKTGSACFFSEDIFYMRQGKIEYRCKKFLKKTIAWLKETSHSNRLVLIATRSLYYLSPVLISESDYPVDGVVKNGKLIPAENDEALNAFFTSFESTLKSLSTAHMNVIYMAPLPELQVSTYRCAFNSRKKECQTSRTLNLQYRQKFMAELNRLEREFVGFKVWDPFDKICDHEFCENIYEGKVLYRDDDHLSLEMAKSLAPDLWNVMSTFKVHKIDWAVVRHVGL